MKKLINFIAFMLLISAQSTAQICGMPDDPPSNQPLSGGCVTSSIWNNNATYIPIDPEITALTIRVNFIFWQREDGIIGNFQAGNTAHNFFINEVIDEMNRRVSNLVDPLANNCYSGNPNSLADARIKFDVQTYYIADGYLWDIENATPNANNTNYCPSTWSQTYTDLAYQRLEENGVRSGLNVFFGNEGSAFQTLIIDHLTDNFNSVASTTDCSESPGTQNNLAKRLRVEMTNEYLKYEFRGNITQDPFWQLDFNALKFGTARVIIHEIGHSFSLGHIGNCQENIMYNGTQQANRNYFSSNQLGQILNSLHLRSVRQYVACEVAGKKPRVLSGYHRWGFDTKVYTDIILEAGAELEICGNVYMPKDGYIHVKRGAKLFVNGGKISFNRAEYDDCPDQYWGGIVVWGNKNTLHSEVDIDNLLSDDPGVVLLKNDALIEYATLGINAFNFEVDPSGDSHPEYSGGIVQGEGSTFKDCRSIAYFTPYPFENDSYFKDCTFFFNGQASVFGGGIRAVGVQHLDFDNCSFRNLGPYGISLLNSGAQIHNGCSFSEMTHGIYTSATHSQTASVLVGSYDDAIPRNTFSQNTCGIYAFGVRKLEVIKNDFNSNNFGVAIKGETGTLSQDNIFDDLIIGESFEQSGAFTKKSSCNVFSNTSRGIYAVGNNSGVIFENDDFNNASGGIDVMLQAKQTSSSTTLGSISSFQGAPWGGVFNLFSANGNATGIYADIEDTQTFNYYTDLNATEPRFIPECPLNVPVGCTDVHNFYLLYGDGSPGNCLDPEPYICNTKNCLEEKYAAILVLKQQSDGGDKDALLHQLATAPTAYATRQALLDASPYLSDEVLKAILDSPMTSSDKAAILVANAALSAEIMQEVEGKLSAARISELETIKDTNPVSVKEELNYRLLLATQEKDEVLYANIKRLEEEADPIAIETLLLEDNTPLALRLLIALKAKWGDITSAESLWQNLPVSTIEESEAKAILEINIQRYARGINFELDASQISNLYTIAEGQSPQAAYAMGLLALLENEIFIPELPKEETKGLRILSTNPNVAIDTGVNKERNAIRFFPNPTNGAMQLDIPTHLDELLSIKLHNIYGQCVQSIDVNNTGKLQVNIENLSTGIYMMTIYKGDEVLFSQKIVRN